MQYMNCMDFPSTFSMCRYSIMHAIRNSFLCPNYHYSNYWDITELDTMRNLDLEKQFQEKISDLKDKGRTKEELKEKILVGCYTKDEDVTFISLNGLQCGKHIPTSCLGIRTKGVTLGKHADILLKNVHSEGHAECSIVVYKVVLGRQKAVLPIQTPPFRDPMPEADCHVSLMEPDIAEDCLRFQEVTTQVYLYDKDDSGEFLRRPRQCVPIAFVKFQRASLPPPLPPSSSLPNEILTDGRTRNDESCTTEKESRTVEKQQSCTSVELFVKSNETPEHSKNSPTTPASNPKIQTVGSRNLSSLKKTRKGVKRPRAELRLKLQNTLNRVGGIMKQAPASAVGDVEEKTESLQTRAVPTENHVNVEENMTALTVDEASVGVANSVLQTEMMIQTNPYSDSVSQMDSHLKNSQCNELLQVNGPSSRNISHLPQTRVDYQSKPCSASIDILKSCCSLDGNSILQMNVVVTAENLGKSCKSESDLSSAVETLNRIESPLEPADMKNSAKNTFVQNETNSRSERKRSRDTELENHNLVNLESNKRSRLTDLELETDCNIDNTPMQRTVYSLPVIDQRSGSSEQTRDQPSDRKDVSDDLSRENSASTPFETDNINVLQKLLFAQQRFISNITKQLAGDLNNIANLLRSSKPNSENPGERFAIVGLWETIDKFTELTPICSRYKQLIRSVKKGNAIRLPETEHLYRQEQLLNEARSALGTIFGDLQALHSKCESVVQRRLSAIDWLINNKNTLMCCISNIRNVLEDVIAICEEPAMTGDGGLDSKKFEACNEKPVSCGEDQEMGSIYRESLQRIPNVFQDHSNSSTPISTVSTDDNSGILDGPPRTDPPLVKTEPEEPSGFVISYPQMIVLSADESFEPLDLTRKSNNTLSLPVTKSDKRCCDHDWTENACAGPWKSCTSQESMTTFNAQENQESVMHDNVDDIPPLLIPNSILDFSNTIPDTRSEEPPTLRAEVGEMLSAGECFMDSKQSGLFTSGKGFPREFSPKNITGISPEQVFSSFPSPAVTMWSMEDCKMQGFVPAEAETDKRLQPEMEIPTPTQETDYHNQVPERMYVAQVTDGQQVSALNDSLLKDSWSANDDKNKNLRIIEAARLTEDSPDSVKQKVVSASDEDGTHEASLQLMSMSKSRRSETADVPGCLLHQLTASCDEEPSTLQLASTSECDTIYGMSPSSLESHDAIMYDKESVNVIRIAPEDNFNTISFFHSSEPQVPNSSSTTASGDISNFNECAQGAQENQMSVLPRNADISSADQERVIGSCKFDDPWNDILKFYCGTGDFSRKLSDDTPDCLSWVCSFEANTIPSPKPGMETNCISLKDTSGGMSPETISHQVKARNKFSSTIKEETPTLNIFHIPISEIPLPQTDLKCSEVSTVSTCATYNRLPEKIDISDRENKLCTLRITPEKPRDLLVNFRSDPKVRERIPSLTVYTESPRSPSPEPMHTEFGIAHEIPYKAAIFFPTQRYDGEDWKSGKILPSEETSPTIEKHEKQDMVEPKQGHLYYGKISINQDLQENPHSEDFQLCCDRPLNAKLDNLESQFDRVSVSQLKIKQEVDSKQDIKSVSVMQDDCRSNSLARDAYEKTLERKSRSRAKDDKGSIENTTRTSRPRSPSRERMRKERSLTFHDKYKHSGHFQRNSSYEKGRQTSTAAYENERRKDWQEQRRYRYNDYRRDERHEHERNRVIRGRSKERRSTERFSRQREGVEEHRKSHPRSNHYRREEVAGYKNSFNGHFGRSNYRRVSSDSRWPGAAYRSSHTRQYDIRINQTYHRNHHSFRNYNTMTLKHQFWSTGRPRFVYRDDFKHRHSRYQSRDTFRSPAFREKDLDEEILKLNLESMEADKERNKTDSKCSDAKQPSPDIDTHHQTNDK